ncbi:hypothetical protein [Neptuniibacter sp.]|uniref:hypothetical protein n=1 Tax=Neptuniibacter sp. TaxID=1962643 RepID=UPI003B5AE58A
MTIEITFPQLMALMVFCLAVLAGMGKLLFSQMQNYIGSSLKLLSDRLEAIENSNSEEKEQWKRIEKEFNEQWKRVERELNDMQKELPLHYVRREDHIRHQTVLETKIDALATKLENVQLRQLLGGRDES